MIKEQKRQTKARFLIRYLRIAVAAMCMIFSYLSYATQANAASEASVCLFSERNFSGAKWCFFNDAPNLYALRERISSVIVSGPLYVELFSEPEYAGERITVMSNIHSMDYMNDRVSSLKIHPLTNKDYACLYQKNSFDGTAYCLPAGQQTNLPSEIISGFTASSVMISGKAEVTLYAEHDGEGESVIINESLADLGQIPYFDPDSPQSSSEDKSWENRAKSFAVYRSFDNSQLEQQLAQQERLEAHAPLRRRSWIGSRNSYNSSAYLNASEEGPNQNLTIYEQLELGVRLFELEANNSSKFCHQPECGNVWGDVPQAAIYAEILSWLRTADDDDFLILLIDDRFERYDYQETLQRLQLILGEKIVRSQGLPEKCFFVGDSVSKISANEFIRKGQRIIFLDSDCEAGQRQFDIAEYWHIFRRKNLRPRDFADQCPDNLTAWEDEITLLLEGKPKKKALPPPPTYYQRLKAMLNPGDVKYELDAQENADTEEISDPEETSDPAVMPPEKIREALECGLFAILSDFWSKQPLSDAAANDTSSDARLMAHIWSWPNGVSGTSGQCAIYSKDLSSFAPAECAMTDEQLPVLCRDNKGQLAISEARTDNWFEAQNLCRTGSHFTVPTYAFEAAQLRQQMAGQDRIWVNYRRIGSDWLPYYSNSFFRLLNRKTELCLEIEGDYSNNLSQDAAVKDGARLMLDKCDGSSDEYWHFDETNYRLHSSVNGQFCMARDKNDKIVLKPCNAQAQPVEQNLLLVFFGNMISALEDSELVLDIEGTGSSGSPVALHVYEGDLGQQWQKLTSP